MQMKSYPKYKDSGIEWIGKIPNEWKVRRIKTLTIVGRGASPRPIDDPKYFDNEGEYSWVRIADVTASNRFLNETSEKLSILGKSFSVPLEPGRLFISIAGTVGKPIITKIKCCIHDGFVYFKNLNLEPEYLYYIFIGGQAYQGLGKLGTQLNLNTETIGSISIPYTLKPQQREIIKFLDKKTSEINDLIAKNKKLIELEKEKRVALINRTVTKGLDSKAKMKDSGVEWIGKIPEGWEVMKFKFTVRICNGQDYKTVEDEAGNYPILGTGGEFGRSSKYLYNQPSVLLGRKGTIDKPQYTESPFWTVDTLFYTKIRKIMVPKFVYYFSINFPFEKYSDTTAVPSMTQEKLNQIEITIPQKPEQQQIVKYLDKQTSKIDQTIKKIEDKVTLMEEYKYSLIHHVVTGKVDVREVAA